MIADNAYVYLLLHCQAHEGSSVYGVFSNAEKAQEGFRIHVKQFDADDPMAWDSDEECGSGYAFRKLRLNELHLFDAAMAEPKEKGVQL